MKVIRISGAIAEVEDRGVRREVRVDFIDDLAVGEYVIVHAGVAIDRLDKVEAQETLRLLEEMAGLEDEQGDWHVGRPTRPSSQSPEGRP